LIRFFSTLLSAAGIAVALGLLPALTMAIVVTTGRVTALRSDIRPDLPSPGEMERIRPTTAP